jgi:hypothetical protein
MHLMPLAMIMAAQLPWSHSHFDFSKFNSRADMARMIRSPSVLNGVGGFQIATQHPKQSCWGSSIVAFDTLVYGKPHQLRMIYDDADDTKTSFVCMKNDGTPLIFIDVAMQPDGLRVSVRVGRRPGAVWLMQTLRPMLQWCKAMK